MSTKMKNGKVMQGTTSSSKLISYDDAFGGGSYELSPEVREDFDKKGYVPKWLDGKELAKNHGRHKRGWKVYKLPKELQDSSPFGEGDGTIRNGGDILGFKTKEDHEKHKKYLQQRADLQENRELAASEFESFGRANGVKVFKE